MGKKDRIQNYISGMTTQMKVWRPAALVYIQQLTHVLVCDLVGAAGVHSGTPRARMKHGNWDRHHRLTRLWHRG